MYTKKYEFATHTWRFYFTITSYRERFADIINTLHIVINKYTSRRKLGKSFATGVLSVSTDCLRKRSLK